jgi:predicted AAA+ superfamily ATPase
MADLVAWRDSPDRKPLVLQGVRQCGKTYLLKEFGRRHFDNLAYVSFDENPDYAGFFETKAVDRVVQNLSLATGQPIVAGRTLLVLDEVQDCPSALGALKSFRENAPDLHVAAAGSLLGVALAGGGFPVGQVDFRFLRPLSFDEFLRATGAANLADFCAQIDAVEAVPTAFLSPLRDHLKAFFVTGGMPEPVSAWAGARDTARVDQTLMDILRAYELDFAKHAPPTQFPKISLIWQSIPSQLARANSKFLYQAVKTGARAREYEDALQWLADAGLVAKVFRSTAPGLPVAAYDDLGAFKLYLVDVGLLRRLARLTPSAAAEGDRLFTEFRGALTENYVLQSLRGQFEATPRYWAQANPPHEVDFLIQRDNDVLPVEAESGTAVASRSLAKFKALFGDRVPLRVRFSQRNLTLDDDLLNIPLPLADQADRLIGLALARTRRGA